MHLILTSEGEQIPYTAVIDNDQLVLNGNFGDRKIRIEFCEMNYVIDRLYNKENNPVFGFTFEV